MCCDDISTVLLSSHLVSWKRGLVLSHRAFLVVAILSLRKALLVRIRIKHTSCYVSLPVLFLTVIIVLINPNPDQKCFWSNTIRTFVSICLISDRNLSSCVLEWGSHLILVSSHIGFCLVLEVTRFCLSLVSNRSFSSHVSEPVFVSLCITRNRTFSSPVSRLVTQPSLIRCQAFSYFVWLDCRSVV